MKTQINQFELIILTIIMFFFVQLYSINKYGILMKIMEDETSRVRDIGHRVINPLQRLHKTSYSSRAMKVIEA